MSGNGGANIIPSMSGLGRNQVWTPDIWAGIDGAVSEAVGQVRVLQKVIPATLVPGAQNVPDEIVLPNGSIQEGATKPLLELGAIFPLTQSQVDDEFTLHFGQRRAIQIAKSVALAEDVALLRGSTAALGGNVQARSRAAAGRGLLWEASSNYMVNGFGVDPNQLFTDLVICIATLNDLGQPGPYALILESGAFANTYKIVAPTTNPVADRIRPLVTGGFYLSGALRLPPAEASNTQLYRSRGIQGPIACGLLISLGGDPVSIYVGADVTTGFTRTMPDGTSEFRVFERVQYVVRDRDALLRLEFEP